VYNSVFSYHIIIVLYGATPLVLSGASYNAKIVNIKHN